MPQQLISGNELTPTLSLSGNNTFGTSSSNTVTFNSGLLSFNSNTTISAVSGKSLVLNGGAGSNGLFIDRNNNIGIGTNAPGYKLDVAGSANVGILTASSLSTIGNATLGSGSSNTVTFNAGTVTLNNSTTISAASTKTQIGRAHV